MPILFVIKNRKAFHSGLKLSCNKQQKPGEECPMQALHKVNHESNSNDAITKLFNFIDQRRHSNEPVSDVAEFERQLREVFAAAECDLLAKELEKLDINVPSILVDNISYRQVLRCEETYIGTSGPVRVIRSLYSRGKERDGTILASWRP
jgi:hypothetical protein